MIKLDYDQMKLTLFRTLGANRFSEGDLDQIYTAVWSSIEGQIEDEINLRFEKLERLHLDPLLNRVKQLEEALKKIRLCCRLCEFCQKDSYKALDDE